MNRFTPLFALTTAGSGFLLAEAPFPTAEQVQSLETAAAKAHPVPNELCLTLLDKLAADIVAPLRTPLRRLWLPHGFFFDTNAFRQAFEHDWNGLDDATERMQELNVQFADVLSGLRKAQYERETRLIEDLSRMPGVTSLDNGMLCEPLPCGRTEENVTVLQADSIEVCNLRGDAYYAAPIAEGDLIDIADLPSCIAELTDSLPKARAWVFIVPIALLSQDECRNMPMKSSYLVFILRHGEKDGEASGAWSRLASAWNNGKSAEEVVPHCETLRTGLSQYAGHTIALLIKKSLYLASSDLFPFDKTQLGTALLRHLNAITSASASPQDMQNGAADREEAHEAYQTIMEARQTEIERGLLRLHAGLPGVHVEESGLQYSVERAEMPEKNKPFVQANRVAVTRINGKKLFDQPMRPADIPCLSKLVASIPDGKSWRFLIPASQIGDYKLLDDMSAGVALTFTVCDAEDEDANISEESSAAPSTVKEKQSVGSPAGEGKQAEN